MAKTTKIRQFTVNIDMDDAIMEHCRDNGMTYSGLICALLRKWAKEHGVNWEEDRR